MLREARARSQEALRRVSLRSQDKSTAGLASWIRHMSSSRTTLLPSDGKRAGESVRRKCLPLQEEGPALRAVGCGLCKRKECCRA
jgi:hypothetical protein